MRLLQAGLCALLAAAPLQAGAASAAWSDAARQSPRARVSGPGDDAVFAIPASVIEPFLTQSIVVSAETLASPARIVALPEGRSYLGPGEFAHAQGLPDGRAGQAGAVWHAYRPLRPVEDPATGKVLGHEADFLGVLRVARPAAGPWAVSRMEVLSSREEIEVGARLMPAPPGPPIRYTPRAPVADLRGAVIQLAGGARFGGAGQVIALNLGSAQGLEPGHVLALARADAIAQARAADREPVRLPHARHGLALVFRVFPEMAYALVTNASNTVEAGDAAFNPMLPP